MTEHSATPWEPRQQHDPRGFARYFVTVLPDDIYGYDVAEVYDEDDQAFILRACNSHEDLLQALYTARITLKESDLKPANVIAQIEEAIARSEGRAS